MNKNKLLDYYISKEDFKRLKGPKNNFTVLCNKTDDPNKLNCLIEELKKANPSHSISTAEFSTNNKIKPSAEEISLTENKIVTFDTNAPKIIIYQVHINGSFTYSDLKEILIKIKLESKIIKSILKLNQPVLLCNLISDKSHLFKSILKVLKTSLKAGRNTKIEKSTLLLRISHLIDEKDITGFDKSIDLKKYLINRLKILNRPDSELATKKIKYFFKINDTQQEIIQEIPKKVIAQEIQNLDPTSKIISLNEFEIYITDFNKIPNTMLEIGRLREETFRKAKEGTGLKVDLDSYDPFYKHLFIWDSTNMKIAGAYRLAEGHKIIPLLGKKGFYISSLFKIKDEFNEVLIQSVELGRSFISPAYQKSNLLLLLMWKGLYNYIFQNPHNRYILGPVSISQEYSKISRLLIIDYLTKYNKHPTYGNFVKTSLSISFS
ncbi:MAG: GNAT family N-acetyltransferase [Saprospiraceae bacterium]|nr:GNAT family N-acetyltransferase [Saprospiraceae bacterium]